MTHPAVSTPKQSDFLAIPESPLAYWLSDHLLRVVATAQTLGNTARVVKGVSTSSESKFIRYHWEVPIRLRRWLPYAKGGGYAKWHGLEWYCFDWEDDGARLKVFNSELYGGVHWSKRVINTDLFGQKGLICSRVARGSLGFRIATNEYGFDSTAIFVATEQTTQGFTVLFELNARVATYVLRSFMPAMVLESGYVGSVPVTNVINDTHAITSICLYLKRHLVATDPTERSFSGVISDELRQHAIAALLHTLEGINEQEVFAAYEITGDDMQAVLAETGTPAGFHPLISHYDTLPNLPADLNLPPLPTEVHDYLASHERINPSSDELARITANLRTLYEAGPGAKDVELDEGDAVTGDDDDANDVSGAHIPIPTETFLEELSVTLEIHPISIYWLLEELRAEGVRCKPEERRQIEDRLSVIVLRLLGHRWPKQIEAGEPVPDWADEDGVIPFVTGTGQPPLVERIRGRLRAEDGDLGAQRTEALLVELTGISLDDWLRREFFKRHVRQFKYRPIAWHLASSPSAASGTGKRGKRGGARSAPAFECLLFYHACDSDVLARIRTQYVDPLLRVERQRLDAARRGDQETEAALAQGRISELEDFNRRLLDVADHGFECPDLTQALAEEPLDRWSGDGYMAPATHADLVRQEQAWRVDLNDGVRVNIAPMQHAGLLTSDVLKATDAKKAIADRARWRSDERRWVRQGKLPRCGWMPDDVPESPAWTALAPQREAEQAKLEAKRRAVMSREGIE